MSLGRTWILAATLLVVGCKKRECNLDGAWEARRGLVPPAAYACEVVESGSLVFHLESDDPRGVIGGRFVAAGYEPTGSMNGPTMTNFEGPAPQITASWSKERAGDWRVVYNVVKK